MWYVLFATLLYSGFFSSSKWLWVSPMWVAFISALQTSFYFALRCIVVWLCCILQKYSTVWTPIFLSTLLATDTWVVSRFLLLWVRLLWICLCKSFGGHFFIYFGVNTRNRIAGSRSRFMCDENYSTGRLAHRARELYGQDGITSTRAPCGAWFSVGCFLFELLLQVESSWFQPFVYFY